jgi:predicted nucleic acid-binding protein
MAGQVSRIYWDTMLFIYWLENNPQYAKRVGAIRARMQERGDYLITGAFTFGEVLAGPYRVGAIKIADETRRLLRSAVSEVVPFTIETADHYARIRGTLGVPPGDAIHLASAAQAGTELFLTNDKNLIGKVVPGIHFIASLDTRLL